MLTKEDELNDYFEKKNISNNEYRKFISEKFLKGREDVLIEEKIAHENLEEEKIKFWKGNREKFQEVDTFIAFASLSSQRKPAFSKSIEIFDGKIKELILICTDQTKEEAEKIKIEGVNIIISLIDSPDDFRAINSALQSEINKRDIDSERMVIDTTMGFKMVSLAFYKLSTEMNIKSLNWKQVQFINKDKNGREFIVPGSDFINVIDNPKLENYKLYQDINEAVENMNFEAAAYLYNSINNSSTYRIYKALAKIFSYENLIDYESFCETAEKEIKSLRDVKLSKSDKNRFSSILVLLENIIKEKSNSEMFLGDFLSKEKIIKYDIKKGVVNLIEDFSLDFEFCRRNSKDLWLSFAIKILFKRRESFNYIDDKKDEICDRFNLGKIDKKLVAEMGEERFALLLGKIFEEKVSQSEESGDFDIEEEDISRLIKESISADFEDNTLNKIFKQCFNFKEEIGKNIYFQNGYFHLKKYDIQIDEKELLLYKTKDLAEWFKNMLEEIFENGEFSKERLKKSIESSYKEREEEGERVKAEKEHKDYEKMKKNRSDKAISRVWKEMVESFNEKFEEEINNMGIKKISGKKILISNENRLRVNEIYLK
jgi:hypothetical protein